MLAVFHYKVQCKSLYIHLPCTSAKTALLYILEIHCKKNLRHTHRSNDSDGESHELEAARHQKSNHPLFMLA